MMPVGPQPSVTPVNAFRKYLEVDSSVWLLGCCWQLVIWACTKIKLGLMVFSNYLSQVCWDCHGICIGFQKHFEVRSNVVLVGHVSEYHHGALRWPR